MPEQQPTLPTPPNTLVGRAIEVAAVREHVLDPAVRLLTLTGTGGTGKTRLALEVAGSVLGAFPDGVWFVNLAPLNDSALVLGSIAQRLGVKEQPDEALPATLAGVLRPRQMLLILDNFEQVVGAAPEIASLLECSAGLNILVTSRTPLRVYGEHQYEVPPLRLPNLAHGISDQELSASEAVALFLQRARAADARFTPAHDDMPAIAEICARLDGLPLAIELAAARVRLLPPRALLARLDRGVGLLTTVAQNVPPRHQTLRRTIDWSYQLLDEPEQALFRRIAVFAGGCTIEAVEAVCGGPPLGAHEEASTFEALASLVDKSLVLRRDRIDGEPRFAMLRTIREYAAELLDSSGELDRVRAAHARFFVELAERAEPELAGPRQLAWLARLEAERENLRAALACSLGSGPTDLGFRLAGALARFWDTRGYLGEGEPWLERALASQAEVDPRWRAKALNAAGNVARTRGEVDRATAWQTESLRLRRALNDVSGVAACLANLGNIAFDLTDYARAARLYQDSLELYGQANNRYGVALAMNNVGIAFREQGDYERATAMHEASLAVRREIGDQRGIGQALDNLGRVALESGNSQRATQLLCEGLLVSQELGDRSTLAMTLEDLGRAATLEGKPARAARLWGAAEALRAHIGTPMLLRRRARYELAVAQARAQLGAAVFDAAWAAGRELDPDQAVAYAQSSREEPSVPPRERPDNPLSPREQEVAALIARGLTSKEIAATLVVSEKTVDAHADHIRQKLGLRSRAEIAAWSAARGAQAP